MLEVVGLKKSWPGFGLEVSLGLAKGEIAAVLGPSGSGKSSLLRLVSGLEVPDAGSVFVGGRDVTRLPPERRGIGMVFQDYALFPHLSVRRNIEYGPRMRGVPRPERRKAAETLAAAMEIEPLLDRPIRSLSGGERQRVALARALAAEPSILLLDEPLSSLDVALRLRLRMEIADSLREAGATAILVTHDPKEALAVADRIFLVRAGRLDSEGSPEALYASPPTAWSASFLGRGPVLEVLTSRREAGGPVVATAFGEFACAASSPGAAGSSKLSLFFPAEAPEPCPPTPETEVARNRLRGRVASVFFEGGSSRLALDCLAGGPGPRPAGRVELIIPSAGRPAPGDLVEFRVPRDRCLVLPG